MIEVISGLGLGANSQQKLGDSGPLGRSQANNRVVINSTTGNLVLRRQDQFIANAGTNFNTYRTYNSLGRFDDDNADNFRFSHNRYLTDFREREQMSRVSGDGRLTVFVWDETRKSYFSSVENGPEDRLHAIDDSDGSRLWTYINGQSQEQEIYQEINGQWRLRWVVDVEGERTRYDYNDENLVRSITHESTSESTLIVYDDAKNVRRLSHLKDGVESSRIHYDYEEYNQGTRLTQVIVDLSPDDNTVYYADGSLQASTYITTYTYRDQDSLLVASLRESDGTITHFDYDEAGRVIRVKLGEGDNSLTTEYHYHDNKTEIRRFDSATRYSSRWLHFNDHGNIAQIEYADSVSGQAIVEQFEYNEHNLVIRKIDAQGLATHYQYDEIGNKILEQDAAGNTVTFQYDERNRLVSETKYLGRDEQLDDLPYDGEGKVDPDFNDASEPKSQHYFYDEYDRLRFRIDADGNVVENRYFGNQANRRILQIIMTDTSHRYQTSENSNLMSLTQLRGMNGGEQVAYLSDWVATLNLERAQVTESILDERGQLEEIRRFHTVQEDGSGLGDPDIEHFVYDQFGKLLKQVGARASSNADNSFATQYVYDSLGRLTLTVDGNDYRITTEHRDSESTIVTTLADGLEQTDFYGAHGLLLSSTRRDLTQREESSQYHYDQKGRLRAVTADDQNAEFFIYDDNDNLVAHIDQLGQLTETHYDQAQRKVGVIRYLNETPDSLLQGLNLALDLGDFASLSAELEALRPELDAGDRRSFTLYNASGLISHEIDAEGYIREYRYDGGFQLVASFQYAQRGEIDVLPTGEISISNLGSEPNRDRVQRFQYTSTGNLSVSIDSNGLETYFFYDSANQKIAMERRSVNSDESQSTYFIRDNKGQVVSEIDASGYRTDYEFDAAGNLIRQERHANAVEISTLNQLALLKQRGKSLQQSELLQRQDAPSSNNQVSQFFYSNLNRLEREVGFDGSEVSYVYDSAGRVLETQRHGRLETRVFQREFDAFGRLVKEINPLAAEHNAQNDLPANLEVGVTYQHDKAGRRISTTDELGNTRYFFYSDKGLLEFSIDPQGHLSRYEYNSFGEVLKETRFNQPLDLESRDVQGGATPDWLQQMVDVLIVNDSAQSVIQTHYRYSHRGQLAEIEDALGFQSKRHYNAFGELESKEQQIVKDSSDEKDWRTSRYEYNKTGRWVATHQQIEQKEQLRSAQNYDAFGRLKSQSFGGRQNLTASYDLTSNQVTFTSGEDLTTSKRIDAFGRTVTETQANGLEVQYRYYIGSEHEALKQSYIVSNLDLANGFLDSSTRSLQIQVGNGEQQLSTSHFFNAFGEEIMMVDAEGHYTVYHYNSNGDRIEERRYSKEHELLLVEEKNYRLDGLLEYRIDADGSRTDYQYDSINRLLTTSIDLEGGTGDEASMPIITQYDFHSRANTLITTDPSGVKTETRFDKLGRVELVIIDPEGDARAEKFEYNGVGEVVYHHKGRYHLNEQGGASFEAVESIEYRYDEFGRQTARILDPDGGAVAIYFRYDEYDNLIAKYLPSGGNERYFYDDVDRQRFYINALGYLEETRYDQAGNPVQSIQYAEPVPANLKRTGDTLALENWVAGSDLTVLSDQLKIYDEFQREVFTLNGEDYLTEYRYDANGQRIQLIKYQTALPNANTLRQMESLSSQDVWAAVQDSGVEASATTVSLFNGQGQEIYRVDALGYVTQFSYTPGGDLSSEQRLAGNVLTQLTSWYNENGHGAILEPDDLMAMLSQFSNASGNADSANTLTKYWLHDKQGQLVFQIDEMGFVSELIYDAAGNVVETKRHDSPSDRYPVNSLSVSIEQLKLHYSDRKANSELRIYNTSNQVLYYRDKAGFITAYQYDALGRVHTETRYAEAVVEEHFALLRGGQFTIDQENSQTLRKVYNALGQVQFEIDNDGYLTEFTYDSSGNIISVEQYTLALSPEVLSRHPLSVQDIIEQKSFSVVVSDTIHEDWLIPRLENTYYHRPITKRFSELFKVQLGLEDKTSGEVTNYTLFYDIDAKRLVTRNDETGLEVEVDLGLFSDIVRYRSQKEIAVSAWIHAYMLGTNPNYEVVRQYIELPVPNDTTEFSQKNIYDKQGQLIYEINSEGQLTHYQYNAVGQVIAQSQSRVRIPAWLAPEQYAIESFLSGQFDNSVKSQLSYALQSGLEKIAALDLDASLVLEPEFDIPLIGKLLKLDPNAAFPGQGMPENGEMSDFDISAFVDNDPIAAFKAMERQLYRFSQSAAARADAEILAALSEAEYDAVNYAIANQLDLGFETWLVANENENEAAFTPFGALKITDEDIRSSVQNSDFNGVVGNNLQHYISRIYAASLTKLLNQFDELATKDEKIEFSIPLMVSTSLLDDSFAQPMNAMVFMGALALYVEEQGANGNPNLDQLQALMAQVNEGVSSLMFLAMVMGSFDIELAVDKQSNSLRFIISRGDNLPELERVEFKLLIPDPKPSWRLQAKIDSLTGNPVLSQTQRWFYDAMGRPEFEIVGNGKVSHFKYNAAGLLTYQRTLELAIDSQAAFRGIDRSGLEEIFSQNSEMMANDQATEFFYDANGKLLHRVDARGFVRSFYYDSIGQLTAERQYLISKLTDQSLTAFFDEYQDDSQAFSQTRLFFDRETLIQYTVDELGFVRAQQLNANQQVLTQKTLSTPWSAAIGKDLTLTLEDLLIFLSGHELSEETAFHYNQRGLLEFQVSAQGVVTEMRYDAFGNVVVERQYHTLLEGDLNDFIQQQQNTPDAARTVYRAFDANNQVIWESEGSDLIRQFRRNSLGQVERDITFSANLASTTTSDFEADPVSFFNNLAKQVIAIEDLYYDGGRMVISVNQAGRVNSVTGSIEQGRIDTLVINERIARQVDAAGEFIRVDRAELNSFIQSHASGGANQQLFDRHGRTLFEIDSVGFVTAYDYDAFGNLTAQRKLHDVLPVWLERNTESLTQYLAGEATELLATQITQYMNQVGLEIVDFQPEVGGLCQANFERMMQELSLQTRDPSEITKLLDRLAGERANLLLESLKSSMGDSYRYLHTLLVPDDGLNISLRATEREVSKRSPSMGLGMGGAPGGSDNTNGIQVPLDIELIDRNLAQYDLNLNVQLQEGEDFDAFVRRVYQEGAGQLKNYYGQLYQSTDFEEVNARAHLVSLNTTVTAALSLLQGRLISQPDAVSPALDQAIETLFSYLIDSTMQAGEVSAALQTLRAATDDTLPEWMHEAELVDAIIQLELAVQGEMLFEQGNAEHQAMLTSLMQIMPQMPEGTGVPVSLVSLALNQLMTQLGGLKTLNLSIDESGMQLDISGIMSQPDGLVELDTVDWQIDLHFANDIELAKIQTVLTAPEVSSEYYYYNQSNELIYSIDALGLLQVLQYDGASNLISQWSIAEDTREVFDLTTRPDQGEIKNYLNGLSQLNTDELVTVDGVRHIYDERNQLKFSLSQSGQLKAFDYDYHGNLVREFVSLRAYSDGWQQADVQSLSRFQEMLRAAGTPEFSELNYFYDSEHRLRYTLNHEGQLTEYEVNAFGETESVSTFALKLDVVSANLSFSALRSIALAQADDEYVDQSVSYLYDENGRIKYETDQHGRVIYREYDVNGNLTKVVNAREAFYQDSLDEVALDNFFSALDSSRLSVSLQIFDLEGNVQYEVAENGLVQAHTYNSRGQITRTIKYNDNKDRFSWVDHNDRDLELALFDSLYDRKSGAVREFAYDNEGNLRVEKTDTGHFTLYYYDANRNLVSSAEFDAPPSPFGNLEMPEASELNTWIIQQELTQAINRNFISYLPDGQVRVMMDASGFVKRFNYGSGGNLETVVQQLQKFRLETSSNLLESAMAHFGLEAGRTEQSAFRAQMLMLDYLELLITGFSDEQSSSSQTQATSHQVYNLQGELQFEVDALGYVTERSYDLNGNLTSMRRYEQVFSGNAVLSQLREFVNSQPERSVQATHYVYDASNRERFLIDDLGQVTEKRYDLFGYLSDYLQYTGDESEYYGTQISDYSLASLEAHVVNKASLSSKSFYDPTGQLRLAIDNSGIATAYFYNLSGQLSLSAKILSSEGSLPAAGESLDSFLLDLVERSDLARELVVYNSIGQVVAEANAEGYAKHFVYSIDGSLIHHKQLHNPLSWESPADQIAQIKSELAFGETPSLSETQAVLERWIEAQQNQLLTHVNDPNQRVDVESTFFDNASQRRFHVNAQGQLRIYHYDGQDRLVSEYSVADQSISPEDRLAMQNDLSLWLETSLEVDGQRLEKSYIYTPSGNIAHEIAGNTLRSFRYDSFGNIIRESEYDWQELQNRFREYQGNISNQNSGPENLYVGNEEITLEQALAKEQLALQDQSLLDQISADVPSSSTRRFFDANGQLIFEVDAVGSVQGWTYDTAGNVTAHSQYLMPFRADVENLTELWMFAHSSPSDEIALEQRVYDDLNQLRFVVDAEGYVKSFHYNSLAQLVETVHYKVALNATDTRYSFESLEAELAALRLAHSDVSAEAFQFSEHQYRDSLGRPRLLVDGEGFAVLSHYDVYGNTVSEIQFEQPLSKLPDSDDFEAVELYIADLIRTAVPDGAFRLSLHQYDGTGQRIGSRGVSGEIVTQRYDHLGQVIETQFLNESMPISLLSEWQLIDGEMESFTEAKLLVKAQQNAWLSQLSELLQSEVEVDRQETIHFDYNNRIEYAISPLGRLTEIHRNDKDQITLSIQYGFSVAPEQQEEAKLNWQAFIAEQLATVTATGKALPQVTRNFYDNRQLLQYTIDAEGGVLENEYDALGNLINQYRFEEPISEDYAYQVALGLSRGERQFGSDPAVFAAEKRQLLPSPIKLNLRHENRILSWSIDDMPEGSVVENTKFYWDENWGSQSGYLTAYSDGNGRAYIDFNTIPDNLNSLEFELTFRSADGVNLDSYEVDTFYYRTDKNLALTGSREIEQVTGSRRNLYVYDKLGRERYRMDPEGYVTEKRYDALGNMVTQIQWSTPIHPAIANKAIIAKHFASREPGLYDDQGNDSFDRSVNYEFDLLGRLVKTVDGMQNAIEVDHDYDGKEVSVTRYVAIGGDIEEAVVWEYRYDNRGNRIQEIAPKANYSFVNENGAVNEINAEALVTEYEYDAFGNVLSSTEAKGLTNADGSSLSREITFKYNTRDQLIATHYPAVILSQKHVVTETGLNLQQSYDIKGNLQFSKNIIGEYRYQFYSTENRLLFEVDESGYTTAFSYDDFNNLVSSIRYVESYFDVDNFEGELPVQGKERHRWLENYLQTFDFDAKKAQIITFEYDQMNREIRRYHSITDTVLLNDAVFSRDNEQIDLRVARTQLVTESEYNLFGELILQAERGVDSEGQVITSRENRFAYNRRGEKIRHENPIGQTMEFRYDAAGNEVHRYSENEDIKKYYDALNQLVKKETKRAAIATLLENETSDNEGQARFKVGETSGVTTLGYEYNSMGAIVAEIDALGGRREYSYDALGRLVTARGVERQLGYASDSLMSTPTIDYAYDIFGNEVVQRQFGNDGESEVQEILQGYNMLGHRLWERDARGSVFYFDWDAGGHLIREHFQRKQSDDTSTTQEKHYTYNRAGLLESTTEYYQGIADERQVVTSQEYNSLGKVTAIRVNGDLTQQFEYDASGQLWRSNAVDGVQKLYGYNVFGQMVITLSAQGDADQSTVNDSVTRLAAATQLTDVLSETTDLAMFKSSYMAYDALGRKIKAREQSFIDMQLGESNLGAEDSETSKRIVPITEWIYDSNNNLTVIGPRGEIKSYWYNEDGQLKQQDINGNKTIYYYDAKGDQIAETNARGYTKADLRNAAGQVLVSENEAGERRYSRFDGFGRLRVTRSGLNFANENQGWRLEQDYDVNNNLIESRLGGDRTRYQYDELGQRIKETRGTGGEASSIYYDYDDRGDMRQRRLSLGHRTTFAYDQYRNKVSDSITFNGESQTQTWLFNTWASAGKASSHQLVDGSVKHYVYDEIGQLRSEHRERGGEMLNRVDYDYFLSGQIKSQIAEGFNHEIHDYNDKAIRTYRYDASGNRIAERLEKAGEVYQHVKLEFDPNQQKTLVSDLLANKEFQFVYDEVGNLTSRADNGNVKSFTYDAANRQLTGEGKTFTYNADGQRTSSRHFSDNMEVVERYEYALNSQLRKVWQNDRVTQRRVYDTAGRVKQQWHNAHDYKLFSYDANGRVSEEQSFLAGVLNATASGFSYDLNGRLLSRSDTTIRQVETYKTVDVKTDETSAASRKGFAKQVLTHGDLTAVLRKDNSFRLYSGDTILAGNDEIVKIGINARSVYILDEDGQLERFSNDMRDGWRTVVEEGVVDFYVDNNGVIITDSDGRKSWHGISFNDIGSSFGSNWQTSIDNYTKIKNDTSNKKIEHLHVYSNISERNHLNKEDKALGTFAAAISGNRLTVDAVAEWTTTSASMTIPDHIAENISRVVIGQHRIYILSGSTLYFVNYELDKDTHEYGRKLSFGKTNYFDSPNVYQGSDKFQIYAHNVSDFSVEDDSERSRPGIYLLYEGGQFVRRTKGSTHQNSSYDETKLFNGKVTQFQKTLHRLAVVSDGELLVRRDGYVIDREYIVPSWESVASNVSTFHISDDNRVIEQRSGNNGFTILYPYHDEVDVLHNLAWLGNTASDSDSISTTVLTTNQYGADGQVLKTQYESTTTDLAKAQKSQIFYEYDHFGHLRRRYEKVNNADDVAVQVNKHNNYFVTGLDGEIVAREVGANREQAQESFAFTYAGGEQLHYRKAITASGGHGTRSFSQYFTDFLEDSDNWDKNQERIEDHFSTVRNSVLDYLLTLSQASYQRLSQDLTTLTITVSGKEVAGEDDEFNETLEYRYDRFAKLEDYIAQIFSLAADSTKRLFVNQETHGDPEPVALTISISLPGIAGTAARVIDSSAAQVDNEAQPSLSTYRYSVRDGDSLSAIAQQVLGDARLWYLIADKNGLSGTESLPAGLLLEIPAVVTQNHNTGNTFKAFDHKLIHGDMRPSLFSEVPSNESAFGKGFLEAYWELIVVIVVAVIVTIAVTIATAGLLSGAAAAGSAAAIATTVAALAVGGLAGSVASQLVAVELGIQEEFSWNQVAVDTAANVLTFGIVKGAGALGNMTKAGKQLSQMGKTRNALKSAESYANNVRQTGGSLDALSAAMSRVTRARQSYDIAYQSGGRFVRGLEYGNHLLARSRNPINATVKGRLALSGKAYNFAKGASQIVGLNVALLPVAVGSAAVLAAVDKNSEFDLEQIVKYSLIIGGATSFIPMPPMPRMASAKATNQQSLGDELPVARPLSDSYDSNGQWHKKDTDAIARAIADNQEPVLAMPVSVRPPYRRFLPFSRARTIDINGQKVRFRRSKETGENVSQIIKANGLFDDAPTLTHSMNGESYDYQFSKSFKHGSKDAVLAIVGKRGQRQPKHLVLYYQSGSQGLWRTTPNINQETGYISKGIGEEAMTLPFQVQKALAENKAARSIDLERNTAAYIFTLTPGYSNRTGAAFGNGFTAAAPKKLKFNHMYRGRPHTSELTSPNEIRVNNIEDGPDFSKGFIDEFSYRSDDLGDLNAKAFYSHNKDYIYTMVEDSDGGAWVGSIEMARGTDVIPEYGINRKAVNTGDLTAPRWEYGIQIANEVTPVGNQQQEAFVYREQAPDHPERGGYRLNDRYTDNIDIVKDYYAFKKDPDSYGYLSQLVTTDSKSIRLSDALNTLRQSIESPLSQEQVIQHVLQGRKLFSDIKSGNTPETASLEQVRSLSWFFQAKGMIDNQGTRPLTIMTKGTMVIKDPDERLFKFLRSAEETYGRPSSHYNERSADKVASWKNVGFLWPKMLGGRGQHGIEDYQGHMPSGKGTMLFGRLKPSRDGGPNELFMKWEEKGTPPVIRKNGKFTFRHGRIAQNALRVIKHGSNFGKGSATKIARREKIKGTISKDLFASYGRIVARNDKKQIAEAGRNGLDSMIVNTKAALAIRPTPTEHNELSNLLRRLESIKTSMGNEMGLYRKGGEIHLNYGV